MRTWPLALCSLSLVSLAACEPEPTSACVVVDREVIDYGTLAVGAWDPLAGGEMVVVSNECLVGEFVAQTVIVGSGASQFRRTSATCDDALLAGGASCTSTVAFQPNRAGEANATLEIVGDDGVLVSVELSGIGGP